MKDSKEMRSKEFYAVYRFWKSLYECEPGMWVASIALSISCGGYAWYKMEHWKVGIFVGTGIFTILAIAMVWSAFFVRWRRDNAYKFYLRSENCNTDTW